MNNGFSTTIVRERPWWRSVVETVFGVSKRELIQRMNALERSNLQLASELKNQIDLNGRLLDTNCVFRADLTEISESANRQDGPKVRRLIKIANNSLSFNL